MSDLISRQAAMDYIGSMNMVDQIDEQAYIEAMNYFESLPSANKSGHWIDDGDCSICSKCHEAYGLTSLGQLYAPNFCPNCGADMRGGDDE